MGLEGMHDRLGRARRVVGVAVAIAVGVAWGITDAARAEASWRAIRTKLGRLNCARRPRP